MVQTKLLQGKMREKGVTLSALSKALDLTNTGLFNKIHGKSKFYASEVKTIAKELSLTRKEIDLIFFS